MARFKHTITQDIPQNETTYVHNHAPSYVGIILVSAACLVAIIWLVQQWLISLLAKLHFPDPEAAFALLMLSLVVGIPLLLLGNWIFRGWAETRHQQRLEIADKEFQRLTVMHKLQDSVVADSRHLDPDTNRRNKLIVALVADGLQGRQNFSYRKAGEYTLSGEGNHKLGKDSKVVREALQWLREQGAIKSNKLTNRYTSIGQLQRELYAPVLASSGPTTTTKA